MRYFGKSVVYNTIQVAGKTVEFIEVEAGQGIIATEDQAIIDALETRIRERRGGIWEMTQEQYDELLKKNNVPSSTLQSQQRLHSVIRGGISLAEAQRAAHRQDAPAVPVAAEVAKQVSVDPVVKSTESVSTSESNVARPSVGKVKR